MDAQTEQHFDAWADHALFDDEREKIKADISQLLADDPDLIDLGWPKLRDRIDNI